MAPYSSTPAWKIPWMEEPGRLQSMGSLRVRHDWATSLSLFIFMHWRRKWQPTPVFLSGESQGRGSLVVVYGVAQSQKRLKRLSSHSLSRWLSGKEYTGRNRRWDVGSIPGLGRSPGGKNGNSLQYSCLENLRDRGVCLLRSASPNHHYWASWWKCQSLDINQISYLVLKWMNECCCCWQY